MDDGTLLAAVDLGSNSFRLEIGKIRNGHIERVEYLKETVRLGAGLNEEKSLDESSMQAGLQALGRFAERLQGFPKRHVRAVATQTLREAKNRQEFVQRGQDILGYPIEIIPGLEEARLIYQGVAHLLPQSDEKRLVVDIGGRSTEFVTGRRYTSQQLASFRVGSVSWSTKYFKDGELTRTRFDKAITAAQAILDEALDLFPKGTCDIAYGSSGTAGAVSEVLLACEQSDGIITLSGLQWLMDRLVKAQHVDQVDLPGLKPDRRPVIGGGVSVLMAVMDLFGIAELHPAQGALRQGAMFDLLARDEDTDIREQTVQGLQLRFGVDKAQANRVDGVASHFFSQISVPNHRQDRTSNKLRWASLLHEIGAIVSHSQAALHGAYLMEHVDAPGFTQEELHRMSSLILAQRGKLKRVNDKLDDPLFVKQLLCLRLATLLCHNRRSPDVSALTLQLKEEKRLVMAIERTWIEEHPQSWWLLQEEASHWQRHEFDYRRKVVDQ